MIAADGVVHDAEGRYASKDGSQTVIIKELQSKAEIVVNAIKPAFFETKYLKVEAMMLHRPAYADGRTRNLVPSHHPGRWQHSDFFEGKMRK